MSSKINVFTSEPYEKPTILEIEDKNSNLQNKPELSENTVDELANNKALSEIAKLSCDNSEQKDLVEALVAITEDSESKIDFLMFKMAFQLYTQFEQCIKKHNMLDDHIFQNSKLEGLSIEDAIKLRKQLLEDQKQIQDNINSLRDNFGFTHFDPAMFVRNIWVKKEGLPKLTVEEQGEFMRIFEVAMSARDKVLKRRNNEL